MNLIQSIFHALTQVHPPHMLDRPLSNCTDRCSAFFYSAGHLEAE